jgi:hypothetical protein
MKERALTNAKPIPTMYEPIEILVEFQEEFAMNHVTSVNP